MPLQDGGHISGLLLSLLCVVLNQRRPLGGPAPSFLSRSARRRRCVSSSFALGGAAAECPAGGTGLTGWLRAAVWTQPTQSKWVGEVLVVQAVASRQAVLSLQGGKELACGQRFLFWWVLWTYGVRSHAQGFKNTLLNYIKALEEDDPSQSHCVLT